MLAHVLLLVMGTRPASAWSTGVEAAQTHD